jgi:Meckel syndrome type 1 protein
VFVSHLAPRGPLPSDRDLASVELWEKSLERSLRRRELAELQRRHAPRTKGTAAVVSATLLASPMLPAVSAAGSGKGAAVSGATPRTGTGVVPTLLREGDVGRMVVAIQRKLAVDDDGIFGPITRQAVVDFQARVGLARTGEVDARTWQALFRASVSYVAPQSEIAERIVREDAAPAPEMRIKPRTQERIEPRAEESPKAVETVPVSTPAGTDESEAPVDALAAPEPEQPEVEAPPAQRPAAEAPRAEQPASAPAPAPAPAPAAAACGTPASPVAGTVTGSFGEDRGSHRHAGRDISAPTGTPVRAVDCGTVTKAASEGGYGNIVCVQHSASVSTCYAHLSSFETKSGDYVEVGQVIGRVGSTGNSTGPHLHFEVRENGRAVDPAPYLDGAAKSASKPATAPAVERTASTPPVPPPRGWPSRPKPDRRARAAESRRGRGRGAGPRRCRACAGG